MTVLKPTHPYLDQAGFLALAHRGGAAEGLENTLAAFQKSMDLGINYLETDAHVTSDGVVVAFHDERLDGITDQRGQISRMPWSEVQKARVGGQEPIPTLASVLSTFPGARFNIDIKSDDAVEPTMSLLEEHQALNRICLGAFSHSRIQRIRARFGARVCTALSPREVLWLYANKFGFPALRTQGACAQVPLRWRGLQIVDKRFLNRAHELGIAVHVWTIDDRDEMTRLIDLGVDGLFTDHPSRLRQVLMGKGLWRA